MTEQYLLDFLQLRKEGKIGRLWTPGEKHGFLLAPDEAIPGCEHKMAEPITELELCTVIDKRMGREPLPERKRMGQARREQVYLPKKWRTVA